MILSSDFDALCRRRRKFLLSYLPPSHPVTVIRAAHVNRQSDSHRLGAAEEEEEKLEESHFISVIRRMNSTCRI